MTQFSCITSLNDAYTYIHTIIVVYRKIVTTKLYNTAQLRISIHTTASLNIISLLYILSVTTALLDVVANISTDLFSRFDLELGLLIVVMEEELAVAIADDDDDEDDEEEEVDPVMIAFDVVVATTEVVLVITMEDVDIDDDNDDDDVGMM